MVFHGWKTTAGAVSTTVGDWGTGYESIHCYATIALNPAGSSILYGAAALTETLTIEAKTFQEFLATAAITESLTITAVATTFHIVEASSTLTETLTTDSSATISKISVSKISTGMFKSFALFKMVCLFISL